MFKEIAQEFRILCRSTWVQWLEENYKEMIHPKEADPNTRP
jgi:hypothetical protein